MWVTVVPMRKRGEPINRHVREAGAPARAVKVQPFKSSWNAEERIFLTATTPSTARPALQTMITGKTVSGLQKPLWPEAALRPEDLPDSPALRRMRAEFPSRPLGPHLGRRYSAQGVIGVGDRFWEEDVPFMDRALAFSVVTLIGATIRIEKPDEIADALRTLLRSKMSGIDFYVHDNWSPQYFKYAMLHGSIPAPPHCLTEEPMALEVYGPIVTAPGGPEVGSYDWDPLGPKTIEIRAATYSNLRYPGVGVPFYL